MNELLYKFCRRDRPSMADPFIQDLKVGKSVCATNGHCLIIIPYTGEFKNIINNDGCPNIDGIIPEFNTPIPVDINELIKVYDDIEVKDYPILETCDSCNGNGQFYHYNHSYDCKECNEKGVIDSGRKQKIKNPNICIGICDICFDLDTISLLITSYNKLNPKKVELLKITNCIIWLKLDDSYFVFHGKSKDFYEDELQNKTIINIWK